MHNSIKYLPNVPQYIALMHGPILLGMKTGTEDLASLIADDSRFGQYAGGKKLPEADALTMAYKAIQSGAKGVDMGRNIFQSTNPIAMCQAVGKVVHENYTDKEAYEFFLDMSK